MSFGVWQILILAIVVLVLFGRGRISEMMGDFGKGISSFKKGMNEGESEDLMPKGQIEAPAKEAAAEAETTVKETKAKEIKDSAG